MDELQTERLRKNRVSIVSDLEPRGKVLDTLYEDGVLTENDLELVSSANTRKERCHILLSLLPTRGPSAYGSFQKALDAGKYDFLASQLNSGKTEILHDRDKSSQEIVTGTKHCQKCHVFLLKMRSQRKYKDDCLCRVVTHHCCLLLDNIEPKDVIDQLFQDHVITADDIDRIVPRATRRDRCESLFEILLSAQNNGTVQSLKRALLKKYSYIAENISNDFDYRQRLRERCESQPEETRRQNTAREHQLLLKTRLIESPFENTDECVESSDDIPEVQRLRKTNLSTDETRELQERSASTFTEPSFQERDERNNTDLKTSAKDSLDFSAQEEEMLHHDDLTCVKYANDGVNTVDGAFVDTSLKHRISEIGNACKGNDYLEKETFENWAFSSAKQIETGIINEKSENVNMNIGKRRQMKQKKVTNAQNLAYSTADEDDNRNSPKRALVPKQATAIQSERPRRRLTVAFNYLSTLINQGDFAKFEETSSKLQNRFSSNYDLMCIIGYLQTSRDLFQTNFDSAKSHIDSTMALVPKTSNPRYFTLELFTAKTRMYITQKKLEKLQTTLDEAMMILETDPVGCTGRAAGWLYINDARNKTAQLTCLNLKKPSALKVYERLFENAKTSFQRSMTNFKRDGGKDGPFGFGYALCRLVILLLRCGDNGLTMNAMNPSADDIHTAGQYLHHLEDSDIVISKILDMHFRLAKCDYQFRRGNCVRALEHAQIAYDLATEMRLLEFTEHAHNRVSFLKPKLSAYFVADELSEEETQRILFNESSDTDNHQSQSE